MLKTLCIRYKHRKIMWLKLVLMPVVVMGYSINKWLKQGYNSTRVVLEKMKMGKPIQCLDINL
jgi:hypothetical protein